MTDKHQQKGDVITVTAATGGIANNAIHRLNECAGVAAEGATGGALCPIALEGVFTVTKAAAGTTAFAVGQKAYATTGSTATPVTGASNLPLGVAAAVAATGATSVAIKLAVF